MRRKVNKIIYKDEAVMEIQLTRGYSVVIDREDYPTIKDLRWLTIVAPYTCYAMHSYTKNGKRGAIPMHRLILGINDPGVLVDHVNRNGLDNRRGNLRTCTARQNCYNTKRRTDNTSGYKGVHLHFGKWQARVVVNGKRISLGHFDNLMDAVRVRDEAAAKHYGQYAYLNIPPEQK